MKRKKLVRKVEPQSKRGIAWPRWTGFRGMTVRNWLDLLIVPLALVVISFLFTMQQNQRQQEIENQRDQQAQKIENQRAEAERELAEQRAQDEALQAYFDQMSMLLLEKNLRNSGSSEEDSEVRTLARARTLTVLGRLDSEHNSDILQFLREAQLISGPDPVVRLSESKLRGAKLRGVDLNHVDLSASYLNDANLSGTNLSDANLNGTHLSRANLSWASLSSAEVSGAYLIDANLSNADLSNADLSGTRLMEANLSNATLSDARMGDRADLSGADLSGADLFEADLFETDLFVADLIDANLNNADLSGADLSRANLSGANLSGADLSDAIGIITEELKQQAASLEGATMPNGQKYEDWLKSKDREQNGKSSGSS